MTKGTCSRVKSNPPPSTNRFEWLKYEFTNETEKLGWISLRGKTELPDPEGGLCEEPLAGFRRELRSGRGFIWEAWNQAAQIMPPAQ